MIRNLIALLFLFSLGLPAMAVPLPAADATAVTAEDCHGMPSPEHGDDQPEGEVRMHGCIGCIAPLAATLPVATQDSIGFTPFVEPVHRLTGTTPRPNLPPPRG
jgi:hypothetical protein